MDFIADSEFSLNDFGVSNYGYELDYNCNGKKIGYRLKADGLWLRKGEGILLIKTNLTLKIIILLECYTLLKYGNNILNIAFVPK
ncbi:hypothetical protein ACXIHB_13090 [Tenacibaculum sp. IMCC1]